MDNTKLKKVITENLRIQKAGADRIEYIDTANALEDARAKQNHVIFARRGCGKTLLLETSVEKLPTDTVAIYLNCEDYKNHSFPNVIIEILDGALRDIEKKIVGLGSLFGNKRKAKNIILDIRKQLSNLKERPDEQQEQIRETSQKEEAVNAQIGTKGRGLLDLSVNTTDNTKEGIEKTYKIYDKKIEKLNNILPELKNKLKDFFGLSSDIKNIYIQIDDFYHLQRELQPYVIDYVHRFCKNLPVYFKIATLRHASTLYTESNGQPIGAQERHDYQPIQIDFTFEDFKKPRIKLKKFFTDMQS
jgi:prefoldin subunit 5